MFNDYALIGIATVDSNYGLYNDKYLNFEDDHKFFNETTSYCIVVMSEDYFTDNLNSIPLMDRFNIIISNTNEVERIKANNSKYSNLPVWFTCSLNPSEWVDHVNSFSSASDNDDYVYDDSRIFIVGGSSMYSLFWQYINVFYLTQVFVTCMCEQKLSSLSNWIPIEYLRQGVIDPKDQYLRDIQYSIDLYVRRS